ncbi:hypothetical protein DIZ27_31755 [Streptomyces sp. NWU339]|uniref:hypothetical protein n=1 Tax=Streptomyces sp. NWU339 TaxID=2185284 RepID=UPI000D683937|nr:hypothetical protein [Streptomyces sp. NWU339]PWI06693.1 hypothetical protein DIZ27_31755 [Streptomyces sp. NWU339]
MDHGVESGRLGPAPAGPDRHRVMARTGRRRVKPCSVWGEPCLTAGGIDTGRGRRRVDLCRDHTLAVSRPSSTMPTALEGILADLGEVLTELGVHVAAAGPHRSRGLVR